MARIYVTLSGSPVSDIRNSLEKEDLLCSDYFYVSQQQLSGVNPDRFYDSGTTVYSNQYKSTKICYADLSSQIFKRFLEYAGFGSMAWELSDDYSLANHLHDYSRVQITSNYTKDDNEGKMLSIASFQINSSQKYVFWMPKPDEYHIPEPSIGQLKFLARDEIPEVDEGSSEFDGWTWPDGRTIQNTGGKFSRAASYFGSSASDPTFTLPVLQDFMKAAPFDAADSELAQATQQRDFLLEHYHSLTAIQLQSESNLTINIKFKRVKTPYKGPNCHAAKSEQNWYVDFPAYFKASNLSLTGTVGSASSSSSETFPSHNLLPVMIYIGKPS